MSDDVFILSAARTPIGTLGGSLAAVPATRLAEIAIRAALERPGVSPEAVEEVLIGNVLSAGLGMNPARQAALAAEIPDTVPATTVNKVCGSGLETVALAARAIRTGDAELIVAGGTESMSGAPYLLPRARFGYRLGHGEVLDHTIHEGLWCAMTDCHMGSTAENVSREWTISREEQDAFAAGSHQRAEAAWESGRFAEEVAPVEIPGRKETIRVERDEHFRAGATAEQLGKLRPAFEKEGAVTAGNASGINDGAAAVVVASRRMAERLGVAPLGRIRSHASAGVPPRVMGMGPVPATRKALERAQLSLGDVDLLEANEAFAAQSLAVGRELGWDPERVNVNGGAIALGHPIGASGTRILVTLLHELKRRDAHRGLATLCIGGGQGIAMVLER